MTLRFSHGLLAALLLTAVGLPSHAQASSPGAATEAGHAARTGVTELDESSACSVIAVLPQVGRDGDMPAAGEPEPSPFEGDEEESSSDTHVPGGFPPELVSCLACVERHPELIRKLAQPWLSCGRPRGPPLRVR